MVHNIFDYKHPPIKIANPSNPDCKQDCGYKEISSGECLCFNIEQDEQPGHPEHG
jgi:hypothetical protein